MSIQEQMAAEHQALSQDLKQREDVIVGTQDHYGAIKSEFDILEKQQQAAIQQRAQTQWRLNDSAFFPLLNEAQTKEHRRLEYEMVDLRNRLEALRNECRPIRARATEIENQLTAEKRVEAALEVLQRQLVDLQGLVATGQEIELAIARVNVLQAENAAVIAGMDSQAAENILSTVGLPGATTVKVSIPEMSKARAESLTLIDALKAAKEQQRKHGEVVTAKRREIDVTEQVHNSAAVDAAELAHAVALAAYLPELATLRRAQYHASVGQGYAVDVEQLVRTMIQADLSI